MINLINGELYKIAKSKITYIMGMLFVVFAGIEIGLNAYMMSQPGMMQDMYGMDKITGIQGVLFSFSGDITFIFIGLFLSIIIGTDYATGSIRQIVAKGTNRCSIILAKYISGVVASLIMLLIYMVIMFVGCSVLSGVGEINAEVKKQLLLLFIGILSIILGYVALAEFFSFLVKGIGASVAVNLMFIFFGGMLAQLTNYFLNSDIIYRHWLSNMSSCFGNYEVAASEQCGYMGVCMIMAVLFLALSIVLFQKRDID